LARHYADVFRRFAFRDAAYLAHIIFLLLLMPHIELPLMPCF